MRWPSFRRKLPMASKVLFGLAAALRADVVPRRSERGRPRGTRTGGEPVQGSRWSWPRATSPRGRPCSRATFAPSRCPLVYAPPAAVTSPDAAIGRVLVGPVAAGEVLVGTRLGDQRLRAERRAGLRRRHGRIRLGARRSVDRRPGRRVRDLRRCPAVHDAGWRGPPHRVDHGREAAFDGSDATSVTLDVDPETARQLLQAAASATLGLAARAPATETPSISASATPEVTQAPG